MEYSTESESIAPDAETPGPVTENSENGASVIEASTIETLVTEIPGTAKSPPEPVPAHTLKPKGKNLRKIIAIFAALFLLMGCIGFIIIHNFSLSPDIEKADEFYGYLDDFPKYDNVHCLIFDIGQNDLETDDYIKHAAILKNNFDLSSFEKCDAIIFMYFKSYNPNTDSKNTATFFEVVLPTYYEYDLTSENFE